MVVNCCTSRMIDDIAAGRESPLIRCPVGQAAVMARLDDEQGVLGGEGSGSVVLPAFSRAFDGFHRSSSSQKPTIGAPAASTPELRLPGRPGVRWLGMTRTGRRGSSDSNEVSGSSLSKTTTVSIETSAS